MALPGLVFYGVGQPVLATLLGWIFAYRAFALWDRLLGFRRQPAVNVVLALMLAAAWAVSFLTALAVVGMVVAVGMR
jgi:hypothetical protein